MRIASRLVRVAALFSARLRLLAVSPAFPVLAVFLAGAAAALVCSAAEARVGGGQSYSGGRRGGGGGGGRGGGGGDGDAGFLIYMLIRLVLQYPAIGVPLVLLIVGFFVWSAYQRSHEAPAYSSGTLGGLGAEYTPDVYAPAAGFTPGGGGADVSRRLSRITAYDPNFSEVSFLDFLYALYGRAHQMRGEGKLGDLSSYFSAEAIAAMRPARPDIRAVTGVIVGAIDVQSVSDPDVSRDVAIGVKLEANYTEVDAGNTSRTYYTVENWTLTRGRDVLSPAPETIAALHCPRCGSGLEKNPDGSCASCGVVIHRGDFHWYVTRTSCLEKENRGPLLTQNVPEEGTDLPTVFDPGLSLWQQRFMDENPGFSWERTEARFRHIFVQLQGAWSSLRWEQARPFETDNVFGMHGYWIAAYRSQGLRNALDDVKVEQLTPVKLRSDAFYDAITVRIWASMRDYTVDRQGKVVSGSPNRPRRFTEYWTFVRRRGVAESGKGNENCPNCGAPLKISMAGVCEYCGGKVTSGNFDWVLSRIEQDESYTG